VASTNRQPRGSLQPYTRLEMASFPAKPQDGCGPANTRVSKQLETTNVGDHGTLTDHRTFDDGETWNDQGHWMTPGCHGHRRPCACTHSTLGTVRKKSHGSRRWLLHMSASHHLTPELNLTLTRRQGSSASRRGRGVGEKYKSDL
jgi:hypothetical protein